MIKLTDILLNETIEIRQRRVTVEKVNALMEKLTPTLTKSQEKTITQLYAKLMEGVTKVNEMQYGYFTYLQFDKLYKEEVDGVARDLITKLNEIIKKGKDKPSAQIAEMTVVAISELCLLD